LAPGERKKKKESAKKKNKFLPEHGDLTLCHTKIGNGSIFHRAALSFQFTQVWERPEKKKLYYGKKVSGDEEKKVLKTEQGGAWGRSQVGKDDTRPT